MKINEIIKGRRSDLGLTQEKVAQLLGVSTPAVNKWEKGSSYPDITLLPPLARLLKIDLNTLLSFKEDLTDNEIALFTNEIVEFMSEKGFKATFEMAMEKIKEYPTCEKLILSTATVLQGCIVMYGVEDSEEYKNDIEKLYISLANSEDITISSTANSMLINKFISTKEFEKAQELIDNLPEQTINKKALQGSLYKHSGEDRKALEIFERELLKATDDIFMNLMQMLEIAVKENRLEDGKYYAKVIEESTELFDLWKYTSYTGYFQMAIYEKNEAQFLEVLKNMLKNMKEPWNIKNSKLYLNCKSDEYGYSVPDQFVESFINSLKGEKDNELDFIKDNEEFKKIIGE